MKYLFRVISIGVLPLSLLILLALTKVINLDFSSGNIIHVNQVKQDSNKARKVKINGTVTRVVPLISSVAYKVKDNTGAIWVISENEAPQVNQNIIINGTLQYQNIDIGEEDFGNFYVVESSKVQANE